VGSTYSEPGTGDEEAFRWTQEKGMVGLGVLPGGRRNSIANGVSADGSVVVGASHGETGREAFVWDSTHGMRRVRDVLIKNFGLAKSLKGWKLMSANAVSADGLTVVGCGINPDGNMEGWIAWIQGKSIPKPTAGVGQLRPNHLDADDAAPIQRSDFARRPAMSPNPRRKSS
jgi:probable HAF family extracellular repeat protein